MRPVRDAYTHPPITVKREQGGEVRICHIGNVEPVEPELGLIFGDCLHNFRAALDNLIFTIAADNNTTLTRDERRALNFPIAKSRNSFREARDKGAIAKLPVRAQATVQRLQPYKTGPEPEWEPLALLKELSDLDKHRFVPMVVRQAQQFAHVIPIRQFGSSGSGRKGEWITNQLVPNTDFFRFTVLPKEAKMDVDIQFVFGVSLQEPERLSGRDAWFWLNDIRRVIVGTVYPALAGYCVSGMLADFVALTSVDEPSVAGLDRWVTVRT